jgi:hypothetical protein
LRQTAGAFIHPFTQPAGSEQLADVLQYFPGGWGRFECHDCDFSTDLTENRSLVETGQP